MGVRPVLLILAGVVAGMVAVLGLAALTDGDDESPAPRNLELTFPAVAHDEAAAENLVVAWDRWRTATFVSSGTWTRTLDSSDSPLSGEAYTAQRPPRRLVLRLGAIIERVDGTLVSCDDPTEPVIVPGCSEFSGGASYEDRLHRENSLVLGYVIGDTRLYDVDHVDECFQVELIANATRSPWGRAARFCFDEETGALASSRVRRESAVDELITFSIRSEVTDADFLSDS
jgi:hypothetical protein